MKITAIKQQAKRNDRYSIFIDDKYAFSLSEAALLDSKLASGQELKPEQVSDYKRLSAEDKIYQQALRYVAMRSRSAWEVEFYLVRKQASPALTEQILNKLSIIGMIDDERYARAFVHDRRLLRPASRRKIKLELHKKRVSEEIIEEVLGEDPEPEQAALQAIIEQKRRQVKYQDNQKLMQYLARQGFNYGDIKQALDQLEED